MFVLSSWWSKITPLPTARKEIQLTELPYMIRLLSFGDDPSQCHSILDEGRDNRKARIKDCLNAVGRKVGLNSFTGLVAKTKQTIWGPHLIQALEDAHEDYVALVCLNQKATVWDAGVVQHDHNSLVHLDSIPRSLNHQIEGGPMKQIHMPSGIIDFGFNIPGQDIVLFSSNGEGYGKGTVYDMCGMKGYGSLKLEANLPIFNTFQFQRIILYPLLLHSLKNFTSLQWGSYPKSIKDAKKKAAALRALVQELAADRDLGGYRVEIRCKGHGDAREWLQVAVAWLNAQQDFQANVQTMAVGKDFYLAALRKELQDFEGMIEGRAARKLCKTHPFVQKYQSVCAMAGYQLLAHEDQPGQDFMNQEAPDNQDAEGPGPDASPIDQNMPPRAPPEEVEGDVPYECWTRQQRAVWLMVPVRVTFMKFGRGEAGWWALNDSGRAIGKCRSAQEACQLYLDKLEFSQ